VSALPKRWHNHDGLRAIYCAALAGTYANPDFNGPHMQGSADEAHKIAKAAVTAALAELEDSEPKALRL